MIDFLINSIYFEIGNHLFGQCIGIPLGTNCAPLLANLFSYSYEVKFLRSMERSNKRLAKAFNLTSRYIDDPISISNPRFKLFFPKYLPRGACGLRDISVEKCCVILGFTD